MSLSNIKTHQYEKARQERRRNDPVEKAKKAAIDKRYREANKASKAAYMKIYRKNHPESTEAVRARYNRWRLKNPDKVKAKNMKRRGQTKEGVKRLGNIELSLIDNYFNRLCGICGLYIESNYEIDHIIPLSKNGTHVLDNLQLAHPICNRTKYNRLQKDMALDIMILRELIL